MLKLPLNNLHQLHTYARQSVKLQALTICQPVLDSSNYIILIHKHFVFRPINVKCSDIFCQIRKIAIRNNLFASRSVFISEDINSFEQYQISHLS